VTALRLRRIPTHWVLLAGGLVWLVVLFALPIANQLNVSLQRGSLDTGFAFQWAFDNYGGVLDDYWPQLWRSVRYAGAATVLALVIGFPVAYFIATRGGRWRTLLLGLVVLPFFTSYLLRTVAWQSILADDGWALGVLRGAGVLEEGERVLATQVAVIVGLTYNFLPFMILPLYVSLERTDRRLIEAATDLYASREGAFFRITLPLARPGIVAGSLLTFIPALGDFVNAQLLGSPGQYMIGNVIQSKYLVVNDYPAAAALAVTLMLLTLGAVLLYTRLFGRAQLIEAAR
jgi:spermidine/putrescine transport system permease protein